MTGAADGPPGALVLSLDFELHWGIRDKHPADGPYTPTLLGARTVIPRLLALFAEFGVAATWATVGFLFARSRDELQRLNPAERPRYRNAALSPYDEPLGQGEEDDPLHYAPSLIEQILATPRQEIGTHTYSHYFCGEEGQTREAFAADLGAARSVAADWGIELRSIVFPRNQHNAAYDSVLRDVGITAYRGNPHSWMWRFTDAEESAGRAKRGARLADAYINLSGDSSVPWEDVPQAGGLADVRASYFIRPFNPRLRHLEPLRLWRMRRAVRDAARRRRILHLWWHPHNFGSHQEQNLQFLRGVLEEYARCRANYGMQSLTMADVADAAGGSPEGAIQSAPVRMSL